MLSRAPKKFDTDDFIVICCRTPISVKVAQIETHLHEKQTFVCKYLECNSARIFGRSNFGDNHCGEKINIFIPTLFPDN
jgi:hypothetical protein